jgi:thioredoxin reductase
MNKREADVLIVGAGPAGLAAAVELKKRGVAGVIVLDREKDAGGMPRHCHNPSFGLPDLHRILSGPAYARRYAQLARAQGVTLLTETTPIEWHAGDNVVVTTSPGGLSTISAQAVLLATGCRERPRHARLVAGSRPPGIYTTGSLQQVVYTNKQRPGTRALVVGAEHVSFSAVETLAKAGCRTVAMVTEHASHQTYPLFRWWVGARRRAPIHTQTRVIRINGRTAIESVDCVDLQSGATRSIACDTIVFTGDRIPDHEFARLGGVAIHPASNGPRIDQLLRTSRHGVFAAGNLLRGAATAGAAALEGRHAAAAIHAFLSKPTWPKDTALLPIAVDAAILWTSPQMIDPAQLSLPLDSLIFSVARELRNVTLELAQGARVLHTKRYARLLPNRCHALRMRLPALSGGAALNLRVQQ